MALVTKSFSDIITFTRASTGTFFNSSGVLTSAAINAPRFDYDPATLAARGLLIEEQRTNLVLQSETLQTTWSPAASSVSANVTVAPSGTTTADKLVEDGATATHVLQQFLTFANATAYTMTGYFKAAERSWCWMFLPAAAFTALSGAYFNLGAGTVGSTISTGVTATIQPVGNGWYRCAITKTSTAAASGNTGFGIATGDNVNNYTGNGTSGIFAWGLQLEAGAFPTSYIPTTTTALTRSADVASVNTLSPWYNATEGTLFAEVGSAPVNTILQVAYELNDNLGGGLGRISTRRTASQIVSTAVTSGGVVQSDISVGTVIAASATYKVASAFKTNDFAITNDGLTPVTSSSGTLPNTIAKLFLGQNYLGGQSLNGYLRRVSYFPRRLANAELQSLTA